MAIRGLLEANPDPTPEEIRIGVSGNICRCGAYHRILKAAAAAAQVYGEGERMTKLIKTRVEFEGTTHEELSLVEGEELKVWGVDAELRVVGSSVAKVDGAERVTGRARYTADIQLPGMLHARALRSPLATRPG